MQNDEVERCQFQDSIVCCKRFSFQLKIFNFQWSVYQLMRAAKNMGGVSFCALRCVLLFMLLKYTTAFYSPPSPSSLMYYISMHPMFSAHIGAWQALHCKSIEECGHWWLSWRKMDKSHIVQIYIDAFLRCHQIWKVETLIGRLNFASDF